MTISEKKNIESVLSALENGKNFFIIGCGECATSCKTGGKAEVDEMVEILKSKGKNVTGSGVCDTTCDLRLLKKFLRQENDGFNESDTVIMLSCGAGIQAIREISDKKIISGVNTMFLGTIERLGTYNEFCVQCGNCTVSSTFGFCTKTRCAKGLVNGPCGNAKDGKCEQGSDKPCIWVLIYDFLKKQGREKEILNISINNDFSKTNRPRKIKDYKQVY